ncbi:MAG: DUF1002 domain-containing protein [Eubacterium sp.]|nr:DUF1002 domain-containing protein [Eubacterium sp.]
MVSLSAGASTHRLRAAGSAQDAAGSLQDENGADGQSQPENRSGANEQPGTASDGNGQQPGSGTDGTQQPSSGTDGAQQPGTGGTDGAQQPGSGTDGTQQPENGAGTGGSGDIQPDNGAGEGQADGTGTDADGGNADGERPEISANISEEEKPKVEAQITPIDEDDDQVVITAKDKPYLALGANLSDEQRNTVLGLMGIAPASLDDYQVATVTNEEEHQYLDAYLDASIIGTRALSSVVIVKRDKGEGIHISTKNISYCTVGMYKNALATAGLEDADVIIAAPFPISGTAALIGAMKAYADMEDEKIDTESLDAAMNEIVVTGELNESLGKEVQTEEFIAYVKQKVVEGGLQSKDKIEEVLAEACDKFEIVLNDSEKAQITSLMEKIGALDIDVDSLLKQAGSIYESLKEMEKSSGILSRIAEFFKSLIEAIINFFKELF